MTIVQLEYLLAVANCGNFSVAAKKCFVTQPSLSMQIKNLEEELGEILLDRTKKPVIPTTVGLAVLAQAREALNAFYKVKEVVGEVQGQMFGSIRLGVLPTIAPYIIHLLVPMLNERCPEVKVEITEMTAKKIVEALDRDNLDVGIMSSGTTPENVKIDELFNDKLSVYLSAGSSLAARTSIRLDDLSPKNLLLLNKDHCLRYQVAELVPSHYEQQIGFDEHYNTGSIETLMSFVDSLDMMTVLPEMAVRMLSSERRKQVKPLARGVISRKIVLATRRGYIKQSIISVVKTVMLEIGQQICD